MYWVTHINDTIQYLPFCNWLISCHVISLRFIYVGTCVRISFLRLNNKHSIKCIYRIFFIPSFVGIHWVISTFLGIVNSAAMNLSVQIPLQDPALNCFGSIPRIGIAGSCGNSVFNTVFHSSCIIIHSH